MLPATDCTTQLKCVVMIGVGHKESSVSVCVISEFNNNGVFWSSGRVTDVTASSHVV